ncbi:MAG: hypothetical protein ABR557_06225 [Pyrinomonadaceae bacterium]
MPLRSFVVVSLLLVVPVSAYAQASSEYSSSAQLDKPKFELEQRKVQIEEEKLELQRKAMLVTGLSVFVPLLIGVYAIRAQARSGFELKAAEIVLNAKSPFASLTKAKALKTLFPKRLPESFARTFDPKEYAAPSVENKIEILKIIAANADYKQEIIAMWKQLFPADAWVDDLTKPSNYVAGINVPSNKIDQKGGPGSSSYQPPVLPGPKID